MATPPPAAEQALWKDEDRLIAELRVLLAAVALLAVVIDPLELALNPRFTYLALVFYLMYSGTLCLLACLNKPIIAPFVARSHWIDVAWYSLLIALSAAADSIFFSGLYFCVFTASFRWGFRPGLKVTAVSVLSFTAISCGAALAGVYEVEANKLLLRAAWLLVLGYMMALWGESEILSRRRLALLKDVATLANPCLGVDRTLGSSVRQLRAFFDAGSCLLIMRIPDSESFELRMATRSDPDRAMNAEEVPTPMAARLLGLPRNAAVLYDRGTPKLRFRTASHALDVITGAAVSLPEDRLEEIASTLDAESFVCVPIGTQNAAAGLLYLTGPRRTFSRSDIAFLQHALEQLMPIVHNIRLVDRLAQHAADDERRRIARDIHDSVVQPYIGIQMGIAALDQMAAVGADLKPQIERLSDMARSGVCDLRQYIRGLEDGGDRRGSLIPAVRRFASRFGQATGIEIQVAADEKVVVPDKLVAEVFQMVTEGLNNIRKHTDSRRAAVRLSISSGKLVLEIENDSASAGHAGEFVPHTIAGRAAALGGEVRVEQRGGAGCYVVVAIPL